MTRAASLLAELYQEGRMPAPAQIKIGSRLQSALQRAIVASELAATRLEAEVDGLHTDLGSVDEVTADVAAARASIKTALGGNGDPTTTEAEPEVKQPAPPTIPPGHVMFQGVPVPASALGNASASSAPSSQDQSANGIDTDAVRRTRGQSEPVQAVGPAP